MFNVTLPDVPPPVKFVPALTAVISPTLDVNPESLLNILKPISPARFLLSALLSNTINSSLVFMPPVISVSSDKSNETLNVELPDWLAVNVVPPSSPVLVDIVSVPLFTVGNELEVIYPAPLVIALLFSEILAVPLKETPAIVLAV